MSTGSKKKRRIDRVTSVELPPGVLGNLWGHLRRGHVLVRLALCAFAAVLFVGSYPRLGAATAAIIGAMRRGAMLSHARNSSERIPRRPERRSDLARSLAIATYDPRPSSPRAASSQSR